eukprot:m.13446 g.13446  ORF g.13446 m.13446 type:complete len:364 (+) comp10158_c0_seq1:174-1265(+)
MFSWNKPASQASSSYNDVRKKQIDSLLQAKLPLPASVQQENALYHVPFQTSGVFVKLVIQLPLNFPSIPPRVTLEPSLSHPWVDSQGNIIGSSSLNKWTIHSNLGQTVSDIVTHLVRNPPEIGRPSPSSHRPRHNPYASNPTQSYASASYTTSTTTSGSFSGYRPPPPAPASSTTPTPAASGRPAASSSDEYGAHTMPELSVDVVRERLKDMDLEELQQLNDDPAKQLEFFETSPYVNLVRDLEQSHRNEAERLARTNLEHEPALERLRNELIELSERLGELEKKLQLKQQRYSELSSQHQPAALHTQLRIKISEADEASEDVVSQFRNGDLNATEFLKQFQAQRKLYHVRKLKEERFRETPH